MKTTTLLMSLVLTGCAHSDPWTTGDTVWQGIYMATAIADGVATSRIHEHPNIIENGEIAGAFLGQNPDPEDVWLYIGTSMVAHYFIARALPEGWRTFWQVGGIWRHGMAVNEANQLGLFGEPCTRHQEEHPCP